jgi:hypothetical protein
MQSERQSSQTYSLLFYDDNASLMEGCGKSRQISDEKFQLRQWTLRSTSKQDDRRFDVPAQCKDSSEVCICGDQHTIFGPGAIENNFIRRGL